jgi:ABC-type antimicrobial peptide transport system permease subunit
VPYYGAPFLYLYMLKNILGFIGVILTTILLAILFYNVFVTIWPPLIITKTGEIRRTMPIAHIIFATGASLICGIIMLIKYIKHLRRNN